MRYCTHPRCKVLVQSGRCHEHQSQLTQVYRRFSKGNYGRPWREGLRAEFLAQAYPWFCAINSPVCVGRDRQLKEDEVEVDHKVPHRGDVKLRDDINNLQIGCRPCHRHKTAKEVFESRASETPARAASTGHGGD